MVPTICVPQPGVAVGWAFATLPLKKMALTFQGGTGGEGGETRGPPQVPCVATHPGRWCGGCGAEGCGLTQLDLSTCSAWALGGGSVGPSAVGRGALLGSPEHCSQVRPASHVRTPALVAQLDHSLGLGADPALCLPERRGHLWVGAAKSHLGLRSGPRDQAGHACGRVPGGQVRAELCGKAMSPPQPTLKCHSAGRPCMPKSVPGEAPGVGSELLYPPGP